MKKLLSKFCFLSLLVLGTLSACTEKESEEIDDVVDNKDYRISMKEYQENGVNHRALFSYEGDRLIQVVEQKETGLNHFSDYVQHDFSYHGDTIKHNSIFYSFGNWNPGVNEHHYIFQDNKISEYNQVFVAGDIPLIASKSVYTYEGDLLVALDHYTLLNDSSMVRVQHYDFEYEGAKLVSSVQEVYSHLDSTLSYQNREDFEYDGEMITHVNRDLAHTFMDAPTGISYESKNNLITRITVIFPYQGVPSDIYEFEYNNAGDVSRVNAKGAITNYSYELGLGNETLIFSKPYLIQGVFFAPKQFFYVEN